MASAFMAFVHWIRPLFAKERTSVAKLAEFLDSPDVQVVTGHLKNSRIGVSYTSLGISPAVGDDITYPQLNIAVEDAKLQSWVKERNAIIKERVKRRAFRSFSERANSVMASFIAPNILDLDLVKEAAALQLFATEPFHILMLGDPGTGKTNILHSMAELHPITAAGIGSGTSKAGLSVMVKGEEIIKGLLPLADQGICCIDELNLMGKDDYAALYSAMENGFVSYDKGGKHITVEARVRVLAASNPEGDRFVGNILSVLKKQIPFDAALLSRFHLVFLLRRPGLEGFSRISKKIVDDDERRIPEADISFLKEYIDFAERLAVEFPKDFEEEVVRFSTGLKRDEKKYLIDISPRIVVGLIRMAKASARMGLRKRVTQEDLERAEEIIKFGLQVRRE